MDTKELDKITLSIKEKIGDESNGMIADDIASLYTFNKQSVDRITKLEQDLEDARNKNEILVNANSKLLGQVPAYSDRENVRTNEKDEEESLKSFNFMDAFDEKGNFKKKL